MLRANLVVVHINLSHPEEMAAAVTAAATFACTPSAKGDGTKSPSSAWLAKEREAATRISSLMVRARTHIAPKSMPGKTTALCTDLPSAANAAPAMVAS